MTPARRGFLNAIFLVLILGSAYDIATDQEHWPFSQYPMFSVSWRSHTFTWLRLFGVTADGREFPLASNKYIAPFDQSRLPKALRHIMEGPDAAERIRTAVADCLARYDALRDDREHGGPPLVAMRLYELDWTIDPDAANVDMPQQRRLITQVNQP
ncbi:MAG TPA: hypothetical protein VGJ29_01395 [Vicinamibacterales bacterium]